MIPDGLSRIAIGFHRTGIVLAVPILCVAAWLTLMEWRTPTGPFSPYAMPEGTVAVNPSEDQVTEVLRKEQETAQVETSPGFIVLGRVVAKARNQLPSSSAEKELAATEWTRFQLRDGRDILVSSTDDAEVTKTAYRFLYSEEVLGEKHGRDRSMSWDGVRVVYAGMFGHLAGNPWPVARPKNQPRQVAWAYPGIAALAAVLVYTVAWAFGWIIDGFATPRTPVA